MKCAKLVGPKQFEITEIKDPEKEAGKSLIEITKTGICGSDLHYFEIGEPSGLVMGHEFCGRIIFNGGRDDLKVGDRVTALPISPCGHCEACLTGNPQYCLETWNKAIGLSTDNPGGLTTKINVRNDMIFKVPDSVSDEEAAMVEPTAVGLHAIHLADIKVGDKVLVIGSGIIGLVSAMFAKMEGASYVAVSEVNEARAKKAVELGVADEYILANDKFNETVQSKVGLGFDKVIECCGNSAAVSSSISAVKPGGHIILVGVSMTPITIPSILAVMHEVTITGAIAYTKEEFKTCIDLMANKQIDVLKFLSKVVPLSETQNSYDELISGTSDSIKIIVNPNK
ncbi:MAG: alcohol dehydrogenase catalytic domain-containing protein [Bacilli bacterium]|nr:alcohol dehydrogenase catalytic domain-containing protein [Bacilli bacterium]